MLAVLHAMIVYQTLGLFSESAEQTRDGELHQPFLLKVRDRPSFPFSYLPLPLPPPQRSSEAWA